MIGVLIPIILVGAAIRDDVAQAQRLVTVSVTINIDGAQRQLRTAQTTVGATLEDAGIVVGPKDMVSPATNVRLFNGMKITVVRVREVIESVSKPIPYSALKTFSKHLAPGRVKQTRQGKHGERLIYFKSRYEDGKLVDQKAISSVVTKRPINRVVSIGSRGRYTSRGEFRTRQVLRMLATAYDPGPRSCGKYATGRTACGLRAGYGVVAVDPRVIPLGTKLYVEGYGYAIAGDRGRSIKGNRIDLGFNTYKDAIHFGTRSVIVHILQE